MMNLCARSLLAISLLASAHGPAYAKPPKLAVLLVVDQLSESGLQRQSAHLRGGGLALLLEKGAHYQQAYYRHGATATGPGHALLGSGQYGSVTGIVGNEWYDYKRRKVVYCAEDASVKASTPTARPMSPRNFEGVSLAQRVKQKYPKSRVVSLSLKDRSAILTTGPGTDAAYWYDDKARQFASSSYYKYDPAVLAFNADLERFTLAHGTWTYSLQVPTRTVCGDDDARYHEEAQGLRREFPHPVRDINALVRTPFGNELLGLLAERVLDLHELGRNPSGQPDVLAVSFSAYDYIGHAFGPDSCEIADATARLDDTLNRLLQKLAAVAPPGQLAVLLSSDHGAAAIPELMLARGRDAGRVNLFDPRSPATALNQLPPLRRTLETAAAANLGYPAPSTGPFLVASFQEPCLYLDPEGPAKGREAEARYWLKGFTGVQEGVQSVHIREDLEAKQAPEVMLLPWRADRGGDVCLILKPNWIWSSLPAGTNHGQPHDYDRHVPVIVWAPGVPAGDHFEQVSAAQVAPTLAALLELPLKDFAEPKPLPGVIREKVPVHTK